MHPVLAGGLAVIVGIVIVAVVVIMFTQYRSSGQRKQHSISGTPEAGNTGDTETVEQQIEESGVLVAVRNAVSRFAGGVTQGMDARSIGTGIIGAVAGAVAGTAVGTTVGFSLAALPATIWGLLFTDSGNRTLMVMMQRLEAAGILALVRDSVDRLSRGIERGVALVGIPALLGALGFPVVGAVTAVCTLACTVFQFMFNRRHREDGGSR